MLVIPKDAVRLATVAACLALVACGQYPNSTAPASATDPDADAKVFLQGVIRSIPMQPQWRAITVSDQTKDNEYDVTLDYRVAPINLEPELDTKEIAHAILQARMAQGHHPATEHTSVFVFAQESGLKGETSNDMVAMFGSTTYDEEQDELVYKPYKPIF